MECAEVRDALNFALLQLQRYFRMLHSRTQQQQQQHQQQQQYGETVLTQSLRGLSPLTPFKDSQDRFVWHWVVVDANSDGSIVKTSTTLPARLDRDAISVPAVIRAARNSDNSRLVQLIEHGSSFWYFVVSKWICFLSDVTGDCLSAMLVDVSVLWSTLYCMSNLCCFILSNKSCVSHVLCHLYMSLFYGFCFQQHDLIIQHNRMSLSLVTYVSITRVTC